MMSIDQYKTLVDAYFEATTTEEEEEKLKLFLITPQAQDPSFDEIKAVMGLTTMLKRKSQNNQCTKEASNRVLTTSIPATSHQFLPKRQLMRWAAVVVLSLSVLAPAAMMWGLSDSDECEAYIDGKKITDQAVVLQQMHTTMSQTLQGDLQNEPAKQLRDLFSTPQQ